MAVRTDESLAILLVAAAEYLAGVVDDNAVVREFVSRILKLPRNVPSDVRQDFHYVVLDGHVASRRAIFDADLGPASVCAGTFERRTFGDDLTRAWRGAAGQRQA